MFLQNKYCMCFSSFYYLLSVAAQCNVLLYILLNLRRTGAMCNLCCALLYILVKKRTYDESTGNSNKNSKDYNLYTLKTNAQDKHDFDLFFFIRLEESFRVLKRYVYFS